MERLTYYERGYARYDFGGVQYQNEIATRLAAYEDTGLTPEEVRHWKECIATPTMKHLVEMCGKIEAERDRYKKAEAEDRLVVLPCKGGDAVWRIKKGICPEKGTCVSGDVCSEMIMGICPDYSGKPTVERSTFRLFDYNDVGKTVFLTREEAEAALKERGST